MKNRNKHIEKELTGREHLLLVQANIKIVTLESDLFWTRCALAVAVLALLAFFGVFFK